MEPPVQHPPHSLSLENKRSPMAVEGARDANTTFASHVDDWKMWKRSKRNRGEPNGVRAIRLWPPTKNIKTILN